MPAQLPAFAIRIAFLLVDVAYPFFTEWNAPAVSNPVKA